MDTHFNIMQQLCQRHPVLSQTRLSSDNDNDNQKPSDVTVLETKPKIKRPSLYKVIMLNDDFTPMEFVIHVLQLYFRKSQDEATQIMLHVHQRGVGVCGLYTYEVAETKASQVMDLARKNQHPLQLQLEKE
jgi:ATP-dependent Clp protease adaptor protein ClpS